MMISSEIICPFGLLPTRRSLLAAGIALLGTGTSYANASEAEVISFDMFYKSFGVRGIEFSDRLKALHSKQVTLTGYMAPPLKAESPFFVLTREPLAICPFCQSDADWPLDIVVVYLKQASPLISAGSQVHVTGLLDIGSYNDQETGFVSQLRLVQSVFRRSR
jgi:hypothetical protein